MSEDPQALGQRLKAERVRRGMSTQKIANGMRLDEWVIDALEAGDYQRIGPAVYAQGHLRKYASLLGVPAAAPPAEPATAASDAPSAPIVRLDKPKESHAAWPQIGTVAAAAILAGGVFWWRESHQVRPAPAAPPSPPQVRASAGDAAASADEPADPAVEGAPPSPSQTNGAPAMRSQAAPAHATAPKPAAAAAAASGPGGPVAADLTPGVGKARLRLSFSADSWVDIRDYSGKRIYEGNGPANTVRTVAGMAPFRVYLRSASGVQLQLNDRAVAIGRQFLSGDEARFEAGADGVLRRDPPTAPATGPQTAAVSPHG